MSLTNPQPPEPAISGAPSPGPTGGLPVWIARDQASLELLKAAEKVKDSFSTLLIQGESGTGKDLLASFIHYSGQRRQHPFLKVDCASIPMELIESELFGYERGAFTGAVQCKLGKLEMAGEGTLVLDEVGSLPTDIQAKLLRVIETKVFERLGSNEAIQLQSRIMVLSGQNLEEAVKQGTFREDLYFRINVVPLKITPLRERVSDIRPLAEHLLKLAKKKHDKPGAWLAPRVYGLLEAYPFPGNVRELRNMIERAVLLAETEELVEEHFPDSLRKSAELAQSRSDRREKLTLEDLERSYIAEILEYTRGRKGKAAAILGISRKTLLEKRKRYGMLD